MKIAVKIRKINMEGLEKTIGQLIKIEKANPCVGIDVEVDLQGMLHEDGCKYTDRPDV